VSENPSTTLRRGVRLLAYLGSVDGDVGVTDVARATGMDKSLASRSLQVLAELGLVEQDAGTRAFRIGWGLFVLAAGAGDRRLRRVAPPLLEELSALTGESAYLSVRERNEVVTIFAARPPRVIQAVDWTGQRSPIPPTSAGRALLFDHGEEGMSRLLAPSDFASSVPAGPGDVAELARRVAKARRVGVAVVEEEFEPGLVGLAAPVRDWTGAIVAAVNLSGPVFRTRGRKRELAVAVRDSAERLGTALGGGGAGSPLEPARATAGADAV